MFYGLSKFFKQLLPKQLFYRGLLIVALPIILLQITISVVFFDSLWIKTNIGMTRALVGEVKTFIDSYNKKDADKNEGHKVMKFNVLQASVRAYQRNLSTHSTYKDFRQERAKLRDKGKPLDSMILSKFLNKYAKF